MAFDLTSTQEVFHDSIHPETTNCTSSVEFNFDADLANNVQLLMVGERASTVYMHSDRKTTKTLSWLKLVKDSLQIMELIQI